MEEGFGLVNIDLSSLCLEKDYILDEDKGFLLKNYGNLKIADKSEAKILFLMYYNIKFCFVFVAIHISDSCPEAS